MGPGYGYQQTQDQLGRRLGQQAMPIITGQQPEWLLIQAESLLAGTISVYG